MLVTFLHLFPLIFFGFFVSMKHGFRYASTAIKKATSQATRMKALSRSDLVVQHIHITDQNITGKTSKVFYIDTCPPDIDSQGEHNSGDVPDIPLMIIPGTGQTVNTFRTHLLKLSRHRRLIIPELRGQGRTELDSERATMPQHVTDVANIAAALNLEKVDLCGFSFGGRVALSVAAHHPHLVNKLSLTGVPLARPNLGKLVLKTWTECLSDGNLRSCAWSFILNGYSQDFIEKHYNKLESFCDFIVENNDLKKLHDLLRLSGGGDFSYSDDPTSYNEDPFFIDRFSIPHCASLVQESRCPVQLIGARQDRIASLLSTKALHAAMPSSQFVEMNTGHLAPFEKPNEWLAHILEFMPGPK